MTILNKAAAVAGTLLAICALPARAASVDDDLRQAARLHKSGDTPAAVAVWRHWADRGDVDAAYNLAVIHQHGDGVVRDAGEAQRWYRQAAERGDRVSQFQLGLMYQVGDGVPADAAKAQEWFTRHRREHLHHDHHPQMQAWRTQAAQLIAERDRRGAYAASRQDGGQVLAELRRRAGLVGEATLAAAGQDVAH
jgi:TPR repeat protein